MKPIDAVATLSSAFQKDLDPKTIEVYTDALADLDPDLLAKAVRECISSHKFFPAVAEIRRAAARIAGLLPPAAGEVLALIRRADVRETIYRRDGSYAYTERYWRWPEGAAAETVALCEVVLRKAGEPCDDEGKDVFGWETAARGVYEAEVPDLEAKALANLSTGRLLEARKLVALPPERSENYSDSEGTFNPADTL